MQNKRSSFYLGLILILVGGAALYNAVVLENFFALRNLWPLFILVPGLFLELDYFGNHAHRDPSVLVPGGILTGVGGFFLLKEFMPIQESLTLPVLLAVVGASLLQFYVARPRDRGLLMVSLVLILSGVFLGVTRTADYLPFWVNTQTLRAMAILLLGIYLVFRTNGNERKSTVTYHRQTEKESRETPPKGDPVKNDHEKDPS